MNERPRRRVDWEEFCKRYEAAVVSQWSASAQKQWRAAAALFRQSRRPRTPADLGGSAIDRFDQRLRRWRWRYSPATRVIYVRRLRAALRWAQIQGLLDDPRIT